MIESMRFTDLTHVYYINLAHRTDRRAHIERQLQQLGVAPVAQRIEGVYDEENGALGCSLSHISAISNVKNATSPVMVVEDDFEATHSILLKKYVHIATSWLKNDWDVLLLGGNIIEHEDTGHNCHRVHWSRSTVGYIVAPHYISTFFQNISEGAARLRETGDPSQYAIDVYWERLQRTGRWYVITPLTVTQLAGYSDVEHKEVDYNLLMTRFKNKKDAYV